MRDLSSRVCPPRAYAICGYKNSGKTTLMVEVIRELRSRGLSVGAIKTDAHGLRFDGEGTDSDRLFRAGAEIEVRGPGETLGRRAEAGEGHRESLEAATARLAARHDLVLVEGGKSSALPKIWLGRDGEPDPPAEAERVERTLTWGSERGSAAVAAILGWLERDWAAAPVAGGVLAGGASRRMGTPKESLEVDGTTLLERTGALLAEAGANPVVRLGGQGGPWPAIPDPPGSAGPLAGIAAALRWAPELSWLVAACDLPGLDAAALAWVLSRRRPGVWAVIPRVDAMPQPLLAVYEPMIGSRVDSQLRSGVLAPSRLIGDARVAGPEVPGELAEAFRGANTPSEWRERRPG